MAKVMVTGYGTLLLQESLGDTISSDKAATKVYRPVVLKNSRRLFNLLPDHYEADNRLRNDDTEIGAANVEPAEGAQFNGLMFEVEEAELSELDKRERYYERASAPCYDFKTGEYLGESYVYESPLDARWIVRDVKKLLPLWRDIVYARVGAYRISEAFGKMYDATTYLADGQSLLVNYYKTHLEALKDLERVRKQYAK